jgi:hypothetical protein
MRSNFVSQYFCLECEVTIKVLSVFSSQLSKMTGKSLFECLNGLRYFGVGSHVTRSIYRFPDTYYVVSKVILSKDQRHGSVWGTMVWRGRPKAVSEKIGAPLKKEWSVVSVPEYSTFKGKVVSGSTEAVISSTAAP